MREDNEVDDGSWSDRRVQITGWTLVAHLIIGRSRESDVVTKDDSVRLEMSCTFRFQLPGRGRTSRLPGPTADAIDVTSPGLILRQLESNYHELDSCHQHHVHERCLYCTHGLDPQQRAAGIRDPNMKDGRRVWLSICALMDRVFGRRSRKYLVLQAPAVCYNQVKINSAPCCL